jgi:hypothetical protein
MLTTSRRICRRCNKKRPMRNAPLCWECRDDELRDNGVYPGGIEPEEAATRAFAFDYLRYRGLV